MRTLVEGSSARDFGLDSCLPGELSERAAAGAAGSAADDLLGASSCYSCGLSSSTTTSILGLCYFCCSPRLLLHARRHTTGDDGKVSVGAKKSSGRCLATTSYYHLLLRAGRS